MGSSSSFRPNSVSIVSCWGTYGLCTLCVLEASKECIQLEAKMQIQNIYRNF